MKKRIRTHTNPFNIRQRLDDIKLPVFGVDIPIHLEVGFGKGRFMAQYARNHLDEVIIGVEVRKQAVEIFKANHNIDNCFPIWGAGHICLEDAIKDNSLTRVFIFHPDPWFKKRHHKRRVVNTHLIDLIQRKLKPGGTVYISTDVYELYLDIMVVLLKKDNKQFISNDGFWHTDYKTHWSQFSITDYRSQFFATFKFKETI